MNVCVCGAVTIDKDAESKHYDARMQSKYKERKHPEQHEAQTQATRATRSVTKINNVSCRAVVCMEMAAVSSDCTCSAVVAFLASSCVCFLPCGCNYCHALTGSNAHSDH
jgi:hypothetical protein